MSSQIRNLTWDLDFSYSLKCSKFRLGFRNTRARDIWTDRIAIISIEIPRDHIQRLQRFYFARVASFRFSRILPSRLFGQQNRRPDRFQSVFLYPEKVELEDPRSPFREHLDIFIQLRTFFIQTAGQTPISSIAGPEFENVQECFENKCLNPGPGL